MDDDNYYLFTYFEYTGTDIEADLAKMGEDETTRKWWKETDPCQLPLNNRKEGERWASMEEIFTTIDRLVLPENCVQDAHCYQ